ncbi:MAG: 50S ribosomal protein L10 [Actinomycetales bacterium]|nr:50S ribosomal protein L10 [Actinomycetales bacterium]
MARPDKVQAVAEIADDFSTSSAAVLTEYRGLTVGQLKRLRRTLGETTKYAVVKNTLAKIGAQQAGVTGLDDMLAGPSAIAFVKGDPVDAAKGIRNFSREFPLLVIKGGWMDGRVLSAAEINKLADLESREVLLAKLAGAMNASLAKAAALFQAPLSKAARTIEALRVAAEANPSLLSGVVSAPAPAAVETAAAESSADETAADAPATEADAAVAETTEMSAEDTSADAPATEADAAVEAGSTEAAQDAEDATQG